MNRRSRKLIRLNVQLRVVFITLFVASFVLLINFQLTLAGLWSISSKLVNTVGVDLVLEEMRSIVIKKFFVALGIAIPLGTSVGILYSFSFCGPIYRFKKYFAALAGGTWNETCNLRKGDDLKDVASSINEAMDQVRSRLTANHELLQEVRVFLEQSVLPADGRTQERVKELKERISKEETFYSERLGSPEPRKEPTPEPSLVA